MTMRSTGHIRERSPGSWEVRYTTGTTPDGKQRVATTTVKGKRRDAERELRRLLTALDTGQYVDPTTQTVAQWLKSWLDTVRAEVAPRTHERYAEIVRLFLIPAFGNLRLQKLATADIQVAYNALATGGRRDGKEGALSPRTRRHINRIFRTALTRAVDDKVIASNPTDPFRKRGRLPKVERKEMTTLTAEQSARLLAALAHSRMYWPVLIALATGARRGEILALRWRNVDLERGTLRVVESLEETNTGLRFKSTKTEKQRAIKLPAFAVDELRRLRVRQAEELLRIGIRQSGDTLLCCRQDGEPKKPLAVTYEFARFIRRILDMPRVRFHDLRHSHATQLLADGIHPKIAQERLGHSSISTTMDMYSHVTDTMQSDAAEKLDAALGSAIKRVQ